MIGLSTVGKPLFARYDLAVVADRFTPDAVAGREAGLWRYEEVLPVRNRSAQVKLGEGWTPLTLIDLPGRQSATVRLSGDSSLAGNRNTLLF